MCPSVVRLDCDTYTSLYFASRIIFHMIVHQKDEKLLLNLSKMHLYIKNGDAREA